MRQKILYIANARLPTEKAHGLQIMNMGESFSRLPGVEVELVVPNRLNPIEDEPFSYYQKERRFVISRLPCVDAISRAPWLKSLAYFIEAVSFVWSAGRRARSASADSLIYTRDLICLLFLPRRYKMVYEAHNLPQRPGKIFLFLLKKCYRLVAITQGLKDDLVKLGFPADRILVAPDAVDIKMFGSVAFKKECRAKLALGASDKIVVYTGHLYPWKGVYTLLEAATKLPECQFVFVGGTKNDLAKFNKRVAELGVANVLVAGHRSPMQIPDYLGAADVLVLPNSGRERISARYTSPMKLFEYMASGRPIVASDLPSLREILNETTATFFVTDDPASLAAAIKSVLAHTALAEDQGKRARELALAKHTWDKRAEMIFSFAQKINQA